MSVATPGVPSFGIATEFDRPVPRLPVPGTLTSGGRPQLQLVDGLARGDGVIGRFETSPALVAVKLAPVATRVRVTVHLAADEDTASWWERRVPEDVVPRSPHAARLLRVRSQGQTRGAVLLARRVEDFGLRARTRLGFELVPDELPSDGFLIVEVSDVRRPLPDAVADALAPHAAVGVRLDAIELAPVTEPRADAMSVGGMDGTTAERLGFVATGGLPGPDHAAIPLRAGFFVTGPVAAARVQWSLRATLVRDTRPDPVPALPQPVIPRPPPGAPPLTTREKALAVARHEAQALRAEARRRARHTAVRAMRRATRPVLAHLGPRWRDEMLRRRLLRAWLLPLESEASRPCLVTAGPGELVTVTCLEPPDAPAIVTLDPVTAMAGARLCWQLVSVHAT